MGGVMKNIEMGGLRATKLLLLFTVLCVAVCTNKRSVAFEKQQIGEFGSVLGQYEDAIDNATVERVVIYAKESETSDKRIPRAGVLVRYPNAIATVLMCHGFMCDKHDICLLYTSPSPRD